MEISELPPFVSDDIHFSSKEMDSYNKPFNFCVCTREAGKSTDFWRKQYNLFRKTGQPALLLDRLETDVSDVKIGDIFTLINKFTTKISGDDPLEPKFKIGDIKGGGGVMNVYLCDRIFFRVLAMNAPMRRLKGGVLENVRYCLLDEFIVDLTKGEKYLSGEAMRFEEIYNTYLRESVKGIRCYFHGNPYSLFNPYFTWLNVDSKKLKPGAMVTGEKYVIQCYQIKEELKKKILEKNPLYEFDDSYKRYAFNGEAVNDENIIIRATEPIGFKLRWIFKLEGKFLGVFAGSEMQEDFTPLHYWVKVLNQNEVGNRRDIIVFSFDQATTGSVMYRKRANQQFMMLKTAMEYREIAFQSIEASYFMEEIYVNI